MFSKTEPGNRGEAPFEGTDITPQEVDRRREFLEFTVTDVQKLSEIREFSKDNVTEIVEEFYKHLLSFPDTRAFFQDAKVLSRVKTSQTEYFLQLTAGSYGDDYIKSRLKTGRIHQNIGLKFDTYLGSYRRYLESFAQRLFDSLKKEPEKALEAYMSMLKLVFLDIGLSMDCYLRTIRLQTEAIKELATPVLQVREGLLVAPIIGLIDTQRARQLTESILWAISSVQTVADLQGGIEEAERCLGYRSVKL